MQLLLVLTWIATFVATKTNASLPLKLPDQDDKSMLSKSTQLSSVAVKSSTSSSEFKAQQSSSDGSRCSVSDIRTDSCDYQFDTICDAGTAFCPENTDCYDCDPCSVYNSCSQCNSDPTCSYCEGSYIDTQTPFGLCVSNEIAQVTPDLCWIVSGITGEFDNVTYAFGTTNCTDGSSNNNDTSTCDVLSDTCDFAFDLVCDTTGDLVVCDLGTDCFDCDPCQDIVNDAISAGIINSDEVCNLCSQAGCLYCVFPSYDGTSLTGVCSSPSIASALPNICINTGGTSYTNTCAVPGATPPPAPAPVAGPVNIAPSTCDYASDTCIFSQNKNCDAVGATNSLEGGFCEANSDCMDCDPCQALRYEGCGPCVAAGCYWCASDALCLSVNPLLSGSTSQNPAFQLQLTCTNAASYVQTCPTSTESNQFYTDPLYSAQSWVYDQIGVVDVWKSGITGAGIGIRINDNGVDADHVEFNSKFDVESSCSLYKPNVFDSKHSHGTTCASIAAGSGNNGACAVGIAPNATISGCRVIQTLPGDDLASELDDESYFYVNMENMHVSSNSYTIPTCSASSSSQGGSRRLQTCPFVSSSLFVESPCTNNDCIAVDWSNPAPSALCEEAISTYCTLNFENDVPACTNFLDLFVKCEFNSLTMQQQLALTRGVTEGRNGKGIVYVFAAGNDFESGADVNFYGFQNSRYGITVGAADKNGKHSSYSNGGAALFISAPGGDSELYTNNVVALAGGGCIDGGAGTSFATPVVAGVVALMLEANPELSWRDVQGILAATATKVQPADSSWTTNAAGLSHSNLYGFGLVNASSAVTLSRVWELLPSEIEIVKDSGDVNISIPDYPSDATSSIITVTTNDTFKIETVLVYLDLIHSSRGDLNIVLTSPSGTQSILSPGMRPENSQEVERWKLLTVRNRNEPANGDWTLSIVDQKIGDVSPCVDAQGWSTDLSAELDEGSELSCAEFATLEVCLDGAEGPLFSTFFPNSTALSDTYFTGTDGLTPDAACCVCGGGLPSTDLADTLLSWRLVIYGSDATAPQSSPTVPAPTPTEGTTPIASSPTVVAAPTEVVEPTASTPSVDSPTEVSVPIATTPSGSSPISNSTPSEPTMRSDALADALSSRWIWMKIATSFLILCYFFLF